MKKNMGLADRVIRTLLAIVFGLMYYAGIISGTVGVILIVLAVVFLLTSLISYCPLYRLFGISTHKNEAI